MSVRGTRSDDTGAMPLAMLLTVVGMLLSAVLASIINAQASTTRSATQGQRALDAAQTGLDVAVGHIRAAADAGGNGSLAELPCGPFAGDVGAGGAAGYEVTIRYRKSVGDPPIPCVPSSGAMETPSYAYLAAIGRDRVTGLVRTIEATYTFRTTNENIAGGLIYVYPVPGSADLCFDAGSADPDPGDPLTVQACSPGRRQQTFAYNRNLTLSLVSSITDAAPLGMCVQAGPVPHTTNGITVTLQPCGATTQPSQQWAYNDNGNFEGTSNGVNLDGYCLNVQNPGTPSAVVLKTGGGSCYQSNTNSSNFRPEAAVGAGAATDPASLQLVNFAEFGRCLDVTNQNWGYAYLIVWSCKQSPDISQVRWNQRWVLPEPAGTQGVISTQPSYETTPVCLKRPLTVGDGAFARLDHCPTGTVPADMRWTYTGDTGDYTTSYTIVDDNGRCLAASGPGRTGDTRPGSAEISTAIVDVCNGSTLQKWNAPPNILEGSPLTDFLER